MPCQSGLFGRPAQHRAQRGVRALPRHPRVENQQRRAVAPILPSRRAARRVDDVRRRRHQHIDELHETKAVVAGHRKQTPRHPGQTCARRYEQRGARRRHAFDEQLPGLRSQKLRSECACDGLFGFWRRERPPGDRPIHGVTPGFGLARVRQRIGKPVQRLDKDLFLDHPCHRSGRLADDPQAGIGGDPDIGEPQDQCRCLHGHVDHAAPSAVTSRPYRSNASSR